MNTEREIDKLNQVVKRYAEASAIILSCESLDEEQRKQESTHAFYKGKEYIDRIIRLRDNEKNSIHNQ